MTMTPEELYSSYSDESSTEQFGQIDITQLTIERTANPKTLIPPEDLVFGQSFTDHMICIPWDATTGWQAPVIKPYQNLQLDPAACVLQYACQCFEGMKAYKDAEGHVRLFRPHMNMRRLNSSAIKISLPTVDEDTLLHLIATFVQMEERFVPAIRGHSLYLRPTIIATTGALGVKPATQALLYVIASPAGPYHARGFKAISLEATEAARAWPGGSGDKKLGANYGPTLITLQQTVARGFDHNLWLHGPSGYITEAGTMNIFVAMRNRQSGRNELITPPLDGMILGGVTRDSVLSLAKERLVSKGWTVLEKKLTIEELSLAADENRLLEVFGTGTAAIISPVRVISWRNRLIHCGLSEGKEAGYIAFNMTCWIESRQYGEEEHPWSYRLYGACEIKDEEHEL